MEVLNTTTLRGLTRGDDYVPLMVIIMIKCFRVVTQTLYNMSNKLVIYFY